MSVMSVTLKLIWPLPKYEFKVDCTIIINMNEHTKLLRINVRFKRTRPAISVLRDSCGCSATGVQQYYDTFTRILIRCRKITPGVAIKTFTTRQMQLS